MDYHIEREYKSYFVMTYLIELKWQFEQCSLLPHLSKLAEKYRELFKIKEATKEQEERLEKNST